MTERLYHIAARADWDEARRRGVYDYDALATDGFIHCSFKHQIDGVLERWFAGRSDLVLLEIDPARLSADVRLESSSGEEFPHLYGPLEIDAVVGVEPL